MSIDVPPRPLVARCPQCPTERYLPAEWREIMLNSLGPEEAEQWDGELRCVNGHGPVVMSITESA